YFVNHNKTAKTNLLLLFFSKGNNTATPSQSTTKLSTSETNVTFNATTTTKSPSNTSAHDVTFTTTLGSTKTVNTTTTATIPTTQTTKSSTTVKPSTTIQSTARLTMTTSKTISPSTSLTATPKSAGALVKTSSFDVGSFVGGIVLTLGLLALLYIGCKTYHSRRGVQYRTM
uniref:Porimin n=1 Tax=Pelusios castaneus TaxID=367368 RepID=A0A8C8VR40_9SAUR